MDSGPRWYFAAEARIRVDSQETTEMQSMTRRAALGGVAGLGALSLAPSITQGAAAVVPKDFNLADPLTALRCHVKMVGSLGTETVYSFFRLNLYGDLGTGNYIPLFGSFLTLIISFVLCGSMGTNTKTAGLKSSHAATHDCIMASSGTSI